MDAKETGVKDEDNGEENADEQISSLEEETKKLSLDSKTEPLKPAHNPTTNGFIHNQQFNNSTPYPKRPPRYLQRRPPTLSRPPHMNLSSPIYQQYSYPPTHPYQAPLAYSAAPQTMQPPHYPMNPVSNISTLNFTPPISPNLATL